MLSRVIRLVVGPRAALARRPAQAKCAQRDAPVYAPMATLKAKIANICVQLEVTVEGGLIPQVKAAAEACGLEYTTLKDTAAALVTEVLGEAAPSLPAVAPPAPPVALVTPEADRKRPRDESNDDCVLVKVNSENQRAAESKAQAEREGRVEEIDDDVDDDAAEDEAAARAAAVERSRREAKAAREAKAVKPPPAKRKKVEAPCVCKTLVANYDSTRHCKANDHGCLCSSDASQCRGNNCPCSCKTLTANYDSTRKCKATSDRTCLCASGNPSECRATDCPCSCTTLVANYDSTRKCKANSGHACLCHAGNPRECRAH